MEMDRDEYESITEFWEATEDWPPDYDGKLFLGRAVLKVGRSNFRDDWEDIDAAKLFSEPVKFNPTPKPDDRTYYEHLARKLLSMEGGEETSLTDIELQEAGEIATRLTELNAARKQRRTEVIDWLIKQVAEGRLTTFLQPKGGGGYSEPVAPERWRAPRKLLAPRFYRCEMDRSDAFSGRGWRRLSDEEYLFVDGVQLDALLAKSTDKPSEKRTTETTIHHSSDKVEAWAEQLAEEIASKSPVTIPTLEEVWELAKKRFPSISRDAALAAWRSKRKPGWEKSGPRGNSDNAPE